MVAKLPKLATQGQNHFDVAQTIAFIDMVVILPWASNFSFLLIKMIEKNLRNGVIKFG